MEYGIQDGFCALVLAINTVSKSMALDTEHAAPGLEPSITIRFSSSSVGGHAPPGQCISNVFLPALAVTSHSGSAFI